MTIGERLATHGLALPAGCTLVSLAERPELRMPLGDLNVSVWPEWMLYDQVANALRDHLFDDFAAYQPCLFQRATGGNHAVLLARGGIRMPAQHSAA